MRIETPFLWFTQTLKGYPKPWLFFKINGLMLNAYEILQNHYESNHIKNRGVHNYMNFDGLIAIDSGGYLFMKKGKLTIKPIKILELYEESKPNFGVILDFPLVPNLSREEIQKRMIITLENTKYMAKAKQTPNPELIPVIHGYNLDSIERFVKKLQKIGEFNIYGIGSLVPSVFNTKGVGGIYNVVKIVSFVKTLLPNKIIHVFGIGSTLTMHLMFYAGANSLDSSSWRIKAAFGAIQLPEIGDRYITPRKRHKYYSNLKREELGILDECKCPACKKEGLEGLRNSFTLRALHNAWVYQKEIEKTKIMIKNGEYENYLKQIIKKTRFSKVLDYIDKFKKRF